MQVNGRYILIGGRDEKLISNLKPEFKMQCTQNRPLLQSNTYTLDNASELNEFLHYMRE